MIRILATKQTRLVTLASLAAVGACFGQSVAADLASDSVMSNLQSIRQSADQIAAGHYTTKDQLQAPARGIALAWSKAEPVLAKSGSALVETKFANKSIATFERDWQTPDKARSDAKDVSDTVADLINAQKK
jgi:hypothetical protein